MSQSTEVILNLEAIEKIKQEVGAEHLPVLLNCFIGELQDYTLLLEGTKNSAEECAEISHSLKSSAASFGADALLECALEIDTAVKQNQSIESPKIKQKLLNRIQSTLETYQAFTP